MLIRYSESNRKAAMGLLSMVKELSNINLVQQTIDDYNTASNKDIYLEKQTGQFIGIVLITTSDLYTVINQLCFLPSENSIFNQNEVIRSLKTIYPNQRIMSSLRTSSTIERFELSQDQDNYEK